MKIKRMKTTKMKMKELKHQASLMPQQRQKTLMQIIFMKVI